MLKNSSFPCYLTFSLYGHTLNTYVIVLTTVRETDDRRIVLYNGPFALRQRHIEIYLYMLHSPSISISMCRTNHSLREVHNRYSRNSLKSFINFRVILIRTW
jgi:hypothetical protein